jgi:hypothetical protein
MPPRIQIFDQRRRIVTFARGIIQLHDPGLGTVTNGGVRFEG